MDLSAGALYDILSSVRAGDFQVSSVLPGVSGPLISLAVTSSSFPRIVPDVRPSHPSSTPPISVAPYLPVPSSSFPSTPLSLLGSSRTGESFPLFYILFSSSGLPLGQLNPFALCLSVTHVLAIPFPDTRKLHDIAILVKTRTHAMSQALSRVSSLVGAPVISNSFVP